ncbi:hypothetical protein ACF061_34345 [Streptomyces sp. NPDC015220]|uniref:hypothetical protein n=1 Tax=Streptomyces sp. NPDC015220 TaxID=3364947 RepID=UPI0036FE892B
MPTTRHHINRQRRRQAREAGPSGLAVLPAPTPGSPAPGRPSTTRARRQEPEETETATGPRSARTATPPRSAERADAAEAAPRRRTIRRPNRSAGLALLCLLTLVLGGFAGWAHARAQNLRDDPAVRNTALSDAARTSEIKGQTEKAVAALFSYDHANPGAYEKAAETLLTGKAVAQHKALLDTVRARADQQKAVITTTVTDSAVERIDGDRARVLVYADQSSVSTAGTKPSAGREGKQAAQDEGTYAGAMFAVDVLRRDGHWLVSGIDTFGR